MTSLLFLICVTLFAQDVQPTFHADLSGSWRISTDDNQRYADPTFDDSKWGTANLPWDGERPLGVYWLRRTIATPATPNAAPLALAIGSVNENYQLYANGVQIGETKGFSTNTILYFQPQTFSLPSHLLASSHLVVAIRILRPKRVVWLRQEYSVDLGPYLLASPSTARDAVETTFMKHMTRRIPLLVSTSLSLLVALGLLWIARSAPDWPELRWLGGFIVAMTAAVATLILLPVRVDYTRAAFITSYTASLAISHGCFTEFTFLALHVRSGYWRIIAWCPLPLAFVMHRLPESLIVPIILPAGLCVALSLRAMARKPLRPLAATIAAYTLLRINLIAASSNLQFLPTDFAAGHLRLPVTSFFNFAIATTLAALVLKRLVRDKNDKQRLANELEAARQVQQLLLPSTSLETADYSLDIVYRPSQEVGGDFYHVVNSAEGAIILVIGDVSGKGLKAAMLVSMIAGALRHEERRQPAAILSALGRALSRDMQGGFATCCCARLDPGGICTIASAGHLAPYLDGHECEIAAGLPLGIVPEAEYVETTIQLPTTAQFTFVSDGVVEAQNADSELYGFDRTRAISTKPATEVAESARLWGQNDDITVVTIRRTA